MVCKVRLVRGFGFREGSSLVCKLKLVRGLGLGKVQAWSAR